MSRNPIARDLRTPKYRPRRVRKKRKRDEAARDWRKELDRLFAHLEELSPDEIVVGADRLAELWADVPVIKTKAPWDALDKYAGFARNEYMIERCQVLAAS